MKLLTAKVENYKSVEDSGEFTLNDISCLVGKNESGKTAILQSLYKLNPLLSEDSDFNDTLEYPRKNWITYRKKREDDPANVLTTTWELTDEELGRVSEVIGEGSFIGNTVTITKGYENVQYWSMNLNHEKVIEFALKDTGLNSEELKEVKSYKTIQEIIAFLSKLDSPSERQTELLNALNQKFPKKTAQKAVIHALDDSLPKFVYFADYYKLPGQISIDQLIQREENNTLEFGDKVFLALLELAGVDLRELHQQGKFEELKAELEAVSSDISRRIFKYWSQNRHLKVQFTLDAARSEDEPPFNTGFVFRTRIWNTRHDASVSFDERSTGFVWFFSFLVWFSQAESNYGDNLIILLDEPGLSLHAKAQSDLLDYFNKELKPKYQVIYTTHSPFLVPPQLDGIKTVEDVITTDDEVLGTKVREDIFSTDPDTVFPLQAAIGYDITQSLFIGKNTLLVEGPSDLLYLKWFSRELERQGKKGLDKSWVITPCGGLDKVSSFVALFRGNSLNIVVLTDFHKGDKAKVKSLQESELLKQGHVFSAELYTGKSESDVEDIIGYENYVELINECYGLRTKNKITVKTTGASERVLEDVENHFRTLPADIPEFDHFTPSAYLSENGAKLAKSMPKFDEALGRFEKIFQDVNALLQK